MKPEDASSQEVKKIVTTLIKDITVLVNRAVKMMNTVARETNKPDK
jgi:hypothetical protein